MSLLQQMQIEWECDREQMRQERERERHEAMAQEERLAAESQEDRSLLKSLFGKTQSNMTTPPPPHTKPA